jgi:hypothetical protein
MAHYCVSSTGFAPPSIIWFPNHFLSPRCRSWQSTCARPHMVQSTGGSGGSDCTWMDMVLVSLGGYQRLSILDRWYRGDDIPLPCPPICHHLPILFLIVIRLSGLACAWSEKYTNSDTMEAIPHNAEILTIPVTDSRNSIQLLRWLKSEKPQCPHRHHLP